MPCLYVQGMKLGLYEYSGSWDETFVVGRDMASLVSPDYGPRGNAFNGEINWVEIDVDKETLD